MTGEILVNGKWRIGKDASYPSHNPANGEVIWQGNAADPSDVNDAVMAARAALDGWQALGLEKRLAYVEAFKKALEPEANVMAELISKETGKMLWDTKNEAAGMVGKIATSLAAYNERTGDKVLEGGGITTRLRHKPHGVCAVFGPYNFPAHLPNGHIVPALLAGNTVVFKPSNFTPLVAEKMLQLWHQVGLPPGVINLVQGGKETGIALASHPELNGLFFTGSVEVGMILHKQFAGHPDKILALELGGNNPLIVHEAGDINAAVLLTLQSVFMTSGQRCTCTRRLIVVEGGNTDAYLNKLIEAASNLKIGAYNDSPEPFAGPLIAMNEADRIVAGYEKFVAGGGKVLLEQKRLRAPHPFLSPAIVDVTNNTNREDQEYFGPLLQVIRVKNIQEAIHEANNTKFGLAAGILTDNAKNYELFANASRAGVLAWNRPTTGASSVMPFGGTGLSGNHRPSAYYAADYCAYPMAAQEVPKLVMPAALPPGVTL